MTTDPLDAALRLNAELAPRKHTYEFVTHPEARQAIFNERRAARSLNLKWRTYGDYPTYDSGYKNALADLGMVMSIKLEHRDAQHDKALKLNAELVASRDALRAAVQDLNRQLVRKQEEIEALRDELENKTCALLSAEVAA